jgi:hypothetical protein
VVAVPIQSFPRIARVIDRLDEDEPESWPWLNDDVDDPVAIAAEVLEMSPIAVAENGDLLEALKIGVSHDCMLNPRTQQLPLMPRSGRLPQRGSVAPQTSDSAGGPC